MLRKDEMTLQDQFFIIVCKLSITLRDYGKYKELCHWYYGLFSKVKNEAETLELCKKLVEEKKEEIRIKEEKDDEEKNLNLKERNKIIDEYAARIISAKNKIFEIKKENFHLLNTLAGFFSSCRDEDCLKPDDLKGRLDKLVQEAEQKVNLFASKETEHLRKFSLTPPPKVPSTQTVAAKVGIYSNGFPPSPG